MHDQLLRLQLWPQSGRNLNPIDIAGAVSFGRGASGNGNL
jgi:hypothetical protein